MISPFLPIHAADAVTLDFGVFIAEQARTHRVSQTAIIAALRPCITQSQPEVPSHAPAADTPASQAAGDKTDGEASPKPSSPSVEPIPESSGAEAHGERNAAEQSAAVEGVSLTTDGPANEGGENVDPPSPTHTDTLDAAAGGSQRADAVALGSAVEPGAPTTLRDRIVAKHHEHPDWPAKLLARACDTSEEQVRNAAQKRKLTVPSWWDYQRKQKAKTTEALRKPVEAEKPFEATKTEAKPKAQPATRPAVPAPVDKAAPSSPFAPADIGEEPRKIKRPAKTRFYLREKLGHGQFLHMSGQGLTDKRIYAWIGTEQQLIAARKAFDVARDLVEEVAV